MSQKTVDKIKILCYTNSLNKKSIEKLTEERKNSANISHKVDKNHFMAG